MLTTGINKKMLIHRGLRKAIDEGAYGNEGKQCIFFFSTWDMPKRLMSRFFKPQTVLAPMSTHVL